MWLLGGLRLTVGILFKELQAPFWVTLPAAAIVRALIGVVFGLPSLRLRGLDLAVSTLALHFVVDLGAEYETKRGFATGIVIDPPSIMGLAITDGRAWYLIALAAAAATLLRLNLLRSKTGRAWAAINAKETVAEALGIWVAAHKLLAFVVSSAITAVAGALFYLPSRLRLGGSLLAVPGHQVAMIIVGGMDRSGPVVGHLRQAFSPHHRGRLARLARCAALRRRAVCRELCRPSAPS